MGSVVVSGDTQEDLSPKVQLTKLVKVVTNEPEELAIGACALTIAELAARAMQNVT